jgi:hypothetical protein
VTGAPAGLLVVGRTYEWVWVDESHALVVLPPAMYDHLAGAGHDMRWAMRSQMLLPYAVGVDPARLDDRPAYPGAKPARITRVLR